MLSRSGVVDAEQQALSPVALSRVERVTLCHRRTCGHEWSPTTRAASRDTVSPSSRAGAGNSLEYDQDVVESRVGLASQIDDPPSASS